MTEIKFRAWDVDGMCWIPQTQFAIAGMESEQGAILTYDEFSDKWLAEIIPVVLMQFTGLLDKNGKEIYEGDIIETSDCLAEDIGRFQFKFDNGTFVASEKDHFLCQICKDEIETVNIKVIGNICENPELLETSP